MGYALHSIVRIFLVINIEASEIVKNTIIKAKDITYLEKIFPFKTVLYPTLTLIHLIPN